MMCKKSKSSAWMRARALYVIPAAALALSVFATPKIVSPVEGAVNNLAGKGTEKRAKNQINLDFSEQEYVRPTDLMSVKGTENSLNRQVMEANNSFAPANDSVYHTPAKNAEYPGGFEECYKFMAQNIKYPKVCQYMGFQGRVVMGFVVEKDGSISDIRKVRGPGKTLSEINVVAFKKDNPEATDVPKAGDDLGNMLEAEAIRVLKMMPRWTPAQNEKGELVRSHFIMPMMFRLQ